VPSSKVSLASYEPSEFGCRQILDDLLSNALKFIPAGGIVLAHNAGDAVVTVRDSVADGSIEV
jgi:signal transduction histidine kinase